MVWHHPHNQEPQLYCSSPTPSSTFQPVSRGSAGVETASRAKRCSARVFLSSSLWRPALARDLAARFRTRLPGSPETTPVALTPASYRASFSRDRGSISLAASRRSPAPPTKPSVANCPNSCSAVLLASWPARRFTATEVVVLPVMALNVLSSWSFPPGVGLSACLSTSRSRPSWRDSWWRSSWDEAAPSAASNIRCPTVRGSELHTCWSSSAPISPLELSGPRSEREGATPTRRTGAPSLFSSVLSCFEGLWPLSASSSLDFGADAEAGADTSSSSSSSSTSSSSSSTGAGPPSSSSSTSSISTGSGAGAGIGAGAAAGGGSTTPRWRFSSRIRRRSFSIFLRCPQDTVCPPCWSDCIPRSQTRRRVPSGESHLSCGTSTSGLGLRSFCSNAVSGRPSSSSCLPRSAGVGAIPVGSVPTVGGGMATISSSTSSPSTFPLGSKVGEDGAFSRPSAESPITTSWPRSEREDATPTRESASWPSSLSSSASEVDSSVSPVGSGASMNPPSRVQRGSPSTPSCKWDFSHRTILNKASGGVSPLRTTPSTPGYIGTPAALSSPTVVTTRQSELVRTPL